MAAGMNRPGIALLPLLLLLSLNPARSVAFELEAVAGTMRPGAVPLFVLSGTWPGGCRPRVASQQAEGGDLLLRLDHSGSECPEDQATPFRLVSHRHWDGEPAFEAPGVLRVRVERARAEGQPQLLAFRLFEFGSQPRRLPEAGFWWSERGAEFDAIGPGIALLLEPQRPNLGATLMGYDDEGRPLWLFGTGALSSGVASVPLQRLDGGRGPFAAYRQPSDLQVVASIWLEFATAARATAWLLRPDGSGGLEVRPWSLVRFRFGESAAISLSGRWLVDGLDGEPRALRLRADADADARGFSLVEDRLAQRLVCELDPARPQSPPAHCRLLDAHGEIEANFDDVGLDHLHGRGRDGGRVTAVRLPY